MSLPKPQKSKFMYHMLLLFEAMDNHLLLKIPIDLFKRLDVDEQSSVLAGLIEEK